MRISRFFTDDKQAAYSQFAFKKSDIKIEDSSGQTIDTLKDCEFPDGLKDSETGGWSENAQKIVATKYFRKTGVPGATGSETSVRQVVQRMADCWMQWGYREGYFASRNDARSFYDEMVYLLLSQTIAPNSPQWFNTGLYESYGINGKPAGYQYFNKNTGKVCESAGTYDRVPANACYILKVQDSLLGEEGIMDSLKTEARIFKFGSGCGANYSTLRSKSAKLESGGTSSGLMSFLKVFDTNAGAIKSGGYTRRSAKMVIVDETHPEVLDFINWKVEEEKKAKALIAAGYSSDYEGEAYRTVSGQQSNNSIAVSGTVMRAVKRNENSYIHLNAELDDVNGGSVSCINLLRKISQATWECGDPGIVFIETCNKYNTMKNVGEIRATNPCAEFIHIDNTACNLASINLLKFLERDSDGRYTFDIQRFKHTIELLTIMLDITVSMSHYPTKNIAYNTYHSRPLGIGFANLGALLMKLQIPYDSIEACSIACYLAAIMTFEGYLTSSEMAADPALGQSEFCALNKQVICNILEKHEHNLDAQIKKDNSTINTDLISKLQNEAKISAKTAIKSVAKYGVRNSQVTAIAPTGTIAIAMDCDTTGIEPPFSLISYKKLSGGGNMVMANNTVMDTVKDIIIESGEKDIDAVYSQAKKYIEEHNTVYGFDKIPDSKMKIFQTAMGTGRGDVIRPEAHINICAAVQGVVSGGISKTINCPNSITVDEIYDLYIKAFDSGMKAVSIYRDGCKSSQPLSDVQENIKECHTCGTGEVCEIFE